MLPFADTARPGASSQSSFASSPGERQPFGAIKAGGVQFALTPAFKKLQMAKRTHPELSQTLQAVADEHAQVLRAAASQRRPGELALKPLNADGARATQPGSERTGRPPDVKGHRVGRHGYLTPGQKKNSRPEGQAVLRRDCPAPARLRMAVAVASEGVTSEHDLMHVLPATWARLEARFARILPGPGAPPGGDTLIPPP